MTPATTIKKIARAALSWTMPWLFALGAAYSCSYDDDRCSAGKEASEMSRDDMSTVEEMVENVVEDMFEERYEDIYQEYNANDRQENDLLTELLDDNDVSETKQLNNIDCTLYEEFGYKIEENANESNGKCCTQTTNGSKACILESYKVGELPRGLAWDGSYLWILDTTIDNKVLKFNVAEGKIEETHETIRGSDLAWDGKKFWMADDNYIYRFNGKFEIVEMIELDPMYCLNGIAFDLSYFYLTNNGCGFNETSIESIMKMNQIAHIVEIYETPGVTYSGMAWNEPYLWVSKPSSRSIIKLELNAINANISDQFPAPGKWIYGIEWQDQYLWVTNCSKEEDNLLKLEVIEK